MTGHGTQSRIERAPLPPPAMPPAMPAGIEVGSFYYLMASYDIPALHRGLCFNAETSLAGPYDTPEARDQAVNPTGGGAGKMVNITYLKIENGRLIREGSFLLNLADMEN